MSYECDDDNCSVGSPWCGNRAFAILQRRSKGNRYDVGVDVVKTSDKGYGVQSLRTFEEDQIIVEYAGEIITKDECERRMLNEYKDAEVRPLIFRPAFRSNICSAIISWNLTSRWSSMLLKARLLALSITRASRIARWSSGQSLANREWLFSQSVK